MAAKWELSKFPLVVVTMQSLHSAEELAEYLGGWKALLDRNLRFVAIADMRALQTPLTPVQRELIAKFYEEDHDRLSQYIIGFASVTDSREHVSAANRIAWRTAPPYPRFQFATMGEALLWAEQQLATR